MDRVEGQRAIGKLDDILRANREEQGSLAFDETTFARHIGEDLKAQGIKTACEHRAEVFALACDIAFQVARDRGTVHADIVQEGLIGAGFTSEQLGNAAGGVFKGKEWEWTGRYHVSARVSNHGRRIMVWRLRNA